MIGSLVDLFVRGERDLLEKRYALVVRKLALRLDPVRKPMQCNATQCNAMQCNAPSAFAPHCIETQ